MRYMRSLIGLALAAAAASCGSDKTNKGAQAPSDMTAAGTSTYESQPPGPATVNAEPKGQGGTTPRTGTWGETPRSDFPQLNPLQLVEGTFSCMLSSSNRQGTTGSSASTGDDETTPGTGMSGAKPFQQGPMTGTSASGTGSAMAPSAGGTTGLGRPSNTTASGCSDTAAAAGVLPTDLAKGDSVAVNGARQSIQTRLTAETASNDVSDNTLALFDKGVAALREGQAAKEAMSQKTEVKPTNSSRSSQSDFGAGQDQIREHKALGELYQFGKSLGMTPIGSEAQALSWVLGVDRFLGVRDLPAGAKSLAAEPLFGALLDVSAPAPTAGRPAPTWNQYLAAAARSVSATSGATRAHGVGGGPAPTADEKGNLRDVGRAVQDRMQLVAQHLPPSSPTNKEVQRSLSDLRDFAGMGSATGAVPSTGQPKSNPSTSQPKSGAWSAQPNSGTSPSSTDSTGSPGGGTTGKSSSPR